MASQAWLSREVLNPRRGLTCRTRFKTAIAAARPFLGLCPSPLLWLKALDALYTTSLPRVKSSGVSPGRGAR
eukprot:scaffold74375_cov58-Phaeocystis_antarctica.AAC.1